jgi:hypothetical protein
MDPLSPSDSLMVIDVMCTCKARSNPNSNLMYLYTVRYCLDNFGHISAHGIRAGAREQGGIIVISSKLSQDKEGHAKV